MGYYENIAICKTEKELLELWKTKKPDTKKLQRQKTGKIRINKPQECFYQ